MGLLVVSRTKAKRESSWADISDVLTDKGLEVLKAGEKDKLPFKIGQLLIFDYEGSKTKLKIMRMDKRSGKVWGKEIILHKPEDLEHEYL